jgi:precorrin-8X/cobalt-precorrin-8 methylmutase
LGGNGAGKSTLLHLLNATLRPTEGHLVVDGKPFDFGRSAIQALRRDVALVLQDPDDQLFAGTVYEDVSFGPSNLGLDVQTVRARVRDALHVMELEEVADLPPHQLSHGQRKRTALAGALAMNPAVLALDEPTAGLDQAGCAALLQQLELLGERGVAVVLSTHDLEFARHWANHVVILHEGRLLAAGQLALLDDRDLMQRAGLVGLPMLATSRRALVHEATKTGSSETTGGSSVQPKESPTMNRPRIHELFDDPMGAEAIERESFLRIDREAPRHGLAQDAWQIARRLIHTTADFGLLDELGFFRDAINYGVAALQRGAPIYADSNMIGAGLSRARLARCNTRYETGNIHVHVADPDVAELARQHALPRAIYALRKAKSQLNGAIVCFGNSPVGLLELNRMIVEEEIAPALVIAMPVGFVHVVESKEETMQLDIPQIVLRGRRGGSPLVVATLHALASLAEEGCA